VTAFLIPSLAGIAHVERADIASKLEVCPTHGARAVANPSATACAALNQFRSTFRGDRPLLEDPLVATVSLSVMQSG
jgi:hypothetical protein